MKFEFCDSDINFFIRINDDYNICDFCDCTSCNHIIFNKYCICFYCLEPQTNKNLVVFRRINCKSCKKTKETITSINYRSTMFFCDDCKSMFKKHVYKVKENLEFI